MKSWDFYSIKLRCVGTIHTNSDDGNDDGDDPEGDDGGTLQTTVPELRGTHSVNLQSTGIMTTKVDAIVIKSTKRYNHAKKLFDEIAAHFSSNDIFTSFVDVMRTVIITCTGGDPEAGFLRIKKYITVDPRLKIPKTKEPTLLPVCNAKQGRPKHNSRGKMVRELNWTARKCSFCLSRNPVHRAGTKCEALMARGMNVELSAQNFPLISTVLVAPSSELLPFDGIRKPVFVHVQNKPASTDNLSLSNNTELEELSYICTLYVHATDCIGTFLVATTTLADWTAQTTCRVYISGSDQLGKSSKSIPQPEKRKQEGYVDGSHLFTGTPAFRDRIDGHVERLRTVWQNRVRDVEDSWVDSRIGRITGTTAKIVMVGKNKPSAIQLSQIFGLSAAFEATTQMQIGNILESQILKAYCNLQKFKLKKARGGQALTLLYQHNYVGHTPDGKTIQSKVEEAEVLEVKVVFGPHDTLTTLVKKHTHQLQLGLFVHRCNAGRLLVYRCNCGMTLKEAEEHEVALSGIEEYRFLQDKQWFAKFKPLVEAFYTQHLQWFYESTFDMQQARLKVEMILTGVDATRRSAALKKRKLLQK